MKILDYAIYFKKTGLIHLLAKRIEIDKKIHEFQEQVFNIEAPLVMLSIANLLVRGVMNFSDYDISKIYTSISVLLPFLSYFLPEYFMIHYTLYKKKKWGYFENEDKLISYFKEKKHIANLFNYLNASYINFADNDKKKKIATIKECIFKEDIKSGLDNINILINHLPSSLVCQLDKIYIDDYEKKIETKKEYEQYELSL